MASAGAFIMSAISLLPTPFTIKWDTACPFIAIFFLCNWILNSLNLIAHLTILPDVLDFCKICLSDVSTIIVWAWNNSRNFVSHQSGCRCASPFLYISFQQHLVICLCSTLATGNFFHLYDQQCSDRHADDADVSKNNSPGKGLANAIKLVKCCLIT